MSLAAAFNHNFSYGGGGRVTWQVNAKNKFTAGYEYQEELHVPGGRVWHAELRGHPQRSRRKAHAYSAYPHTWMVPVTWSSPVTNRLLLEAGFLGSQRTERVERPDAAARRLRRLDLIPVLDFGTGIAYHGTVPIVTAMYSDFVDPVPQARAAAIVRLRRPRVQGRLHLSLQPFGGAEHRQQLSAFGTSSSTAFRSASCRWPRRSTPISEGARSALYAQDRWTIKRLTLNLGVRFDQYKTWYPDHHVRAGTLVPTRNFTIPGQDFYDLKDLSPRLGVVYDVFGNGKTAIRATANRYATGFSTAYWDGNPASPLAGLVANTLLNLATGAGPTPIGTLRRTAIWRARQPTGSAGRCRRASASRSSARPSIPRRSTGWGNRRLQLGVLRRRPAGTAPARVGGRRLYPTGVRQPPGHRQPGAGAVRLRSVQRHGPGGSASCRAAVAT